MVFFQFERDLLVFGL
jgi:hypothetical protein